MTKLRCYSAAGLTYSPRQGLFAHVNELGLVLGIPQAFVEHALPFVTIFNGSSNVDVTIASPEVVAAQLGDAPANLNSATSGAASPSGGPNEAAAATPSAATSPKSGSFRASILVKLRDGRRLTSEVVFVLGGDGVPYRVLSWQDELTSGQRQQRGARLQ